MKQKIGPLANFADDFLMLASFALKKLIHGREGAIFMWPRTINRCRFRYYGSRPATMSEGRHKDQQCFESKYGRLKITWGHKPIVG